MLMNMKQGFVLFWLNYPETNRSESVYELLDYLHGQKHRAVLSYY